MEYKKQPLILALYLPQFYRIPENDRWWGEGFTEWVNVKKAAPLFTGHVQPRRPLNNNYYSLADDPDNTVMREQALLADSFGVSGFCFYHYWFEGKQLLEAPAERYRRDGQIDLPYCLCWANHTWLNAWAGPRLQDTIFIKQRYGNEEAWRRHFNYLLDFFRDDRYIKIDHKPVFFMYMPKDMPRLERMIELWNQWAREAGFAGLYLIQMHSAAGFDVRRDLFSAKVDFEPLRTWSKKAAGTEMELSIPAAEKESLKKLGVHDYDLIYEKILARKYTKADRIFYGAFTDWDNTPRRGRLGITVRGSTPEKFQKYLFELLRRSAIAENEILLINAWNEWAEGAYMEPDEQHGHGYLQAVKNARAMLAQWQKNPSVDIEPQGGEADADAEPKVHSPYFYAAKWLYNEVSGLHAADFLADAGFRTIAIYGAGQLGMVLLKAMENGPVEAVYIIDQDAALLDYHKETKVVSITEAVTMPKVDAIIVTVVNGFAEIYQELKTAGLDAEIIHINAIIDCL